VGEKRTEERGRGSNGSENGKERSKRPKIGGPAKSNTARKKEGLEVK